MGSQSIGRLVSASCVRIPRALVRYWLVFAVGFVVGGVMNQRPLTKAEQLERITNGEIEKRLRAYARGENESVVASKRFAEAISQASAK